MQRAAALVESSGGIRNDSAEVTRVAQSVTQLAGGDGDEVLDLKWIHRGLTEIPQARSRLQSGVFKSGTMS